MADYKFPTEMVDLPSKGYFYFDGHPLSSGKVEVKYMTAKEEDILTSTNLIEQGIVIDKLLESLIVDKNIKVDDLLIGDKNAIMIAARILGYGKDYEFNLRDTEYKSDLKHIITSVDGNSEISYINNFVDNEFLSRDSLEFRKYLNSITPDIDMNATAIDSEGKETEVVIPITVRFFWPSSNL